MPNVLTNPVSQLRESKPAQCYSVDPYHQEQPPPVFFFLFGRGAQCRITIELQGTEHGIT